MLITYWHKNGTVQEVFSHPLWDTYMCLKHWSEVIILALMLYIFKDEDKSYSAWKLIWITKDGSANFK